MRGHPGPFGSRCAWRRRRVVLVLDVLIPEDVSEAALQHHLDRCLDLALTIAGARGARVGCAIARSPEPAKKQPL